MRLHSSR